LMGAELTVRRYCIAGIDLDCTISKMQALIGTGKTYGPAGRAGHVEG
jgi:hypothetical protein